MVVKFKIGTGFAANVEGLGKLLLAEMYVTNEEL